MIPLGDNLKFYEEVKNLLSEYSGVSKRKISLETKIGADLGLDGDDAKEILNMIWQKFEVDTSNFDFNQYFHDETEINSFKVLFQSLFENKAKKNNMDISVERIVLAIKEKKW